MRIVIEIEGIEDADPIVVRVGRGDKNADTVRPATRLASTADTEAIDAGSAPDSAAAEWAGPTVEADEEADGGSDTAGATWH